MKRFVLTLALLVVCAVPVAAQTALNETTVARAIAPSDTVVVVASASGAVPGGGIYIGREYMRITSTYDGVSTTIPVIRSGRVVAHAVGTPVYIGPTQAFITSDRDGACVASREAYLPQINTSNGNIWDCSSTVEKWVNLRDLVIVACRANLPADMVDQSCFTANRPYLVYQITYVHKTPESGGTLTVIPRRQQGTEAPASGDQLTAAAINAVSTVAETVTTPALTATEANLILYTGDRLGLDFTDDTAGELAGVLVTFYLYPL